MKILITIILFLNSFSNLSYSQTAGEITAMQEVSFSLDEIKEYEDAKNNSNEIEMVFSGLFLFYKHFISSQDGMSCSFTPSCSEFGIQAVKKQGMAAGMMNTFDRLTRCNGLDQHKYPVDPKTKLFYDPL